MHTIKYLGPILFSAVLYSNAQAQNDLSANLSMAERMKNIMQENYEPSHTTRVDIDTISSQLKGQQKILDMDGKVLKEGIFKNGLLREGFLYRYSVSGKLIEKIIYKNGSYLTKVTP